MRNFLLFSVSPVAVFAVGSLAGFSALFSRLVVGLFGLPVLVLLRAVRVVLPRYFLWAGGLGGSRFSWLRLFWCFARSVFFVLLFAPFGFLRSVAVSRLTLRSSGTGRYVTSFMSSDSLNNLGACHVQWSASPLASR